MLLRLAEALNVKPEAACWSQSPAIRGHCYRLKGEPVPGVAVGSPIATWMGRRRAGLPAAPSRRTHATSDKPRSMGMLRDGHKDIVTQDHWRR